MLQTCCKGNKELLQPHNVMRLQYQGNDVVINRALLALADAIKKSASKVLISLACRNIDVMLGATCLVEDLPFEDTA